MELLIQDWLTKIDAVPVIFVDTSRDDPSYESFINSLVDRVSQILKGS